MRRQRKCRNCRELFFPDRRSYRPTRENPALVISPQKFCSKPECQKQSDRESHQTHVKNNPLYRQKQLLSARRWRKKNSGFWGQWRQEHPEVVERNRVLQRRRDAKAKTDLANINSIEAVCAEKLHRIERLIDLANINPIRISWMTVSEEIRSVLKWRWHLANIKPIGNHEKNQPQSHP